MDKRLAQYPAEHRLNLYVVEQSIIKAKWHEVIEIWRDAGYNMERVNLKVNLRPYIDIEFIIKPAKNDDEYFSVEYLSDIPTPERLKIFANECHNLLHDRMIMTILDGAYTFGTIVQPRY